MSQSPNQPQDQPHDQRHNGELLESLRSAIDGIHDSLDSVGELVLDVPHQSIVAVCTLLRDQHAFEQLIDICGVDNLHYGAEGSYPEASASTLMTASRFRVVYHLLSVSRNERLRLRVDVNEEFPALQSVYTVWAAADWFEREAFDMYGIMFEGHPDLRRLLTDYGFIGHPFRKDFPLSGHVEMRYDPEKGRVVYQPVSIESRVLVPRRITPQPTKLQPSQQVDQSSE